jgi:hypothetical protein
MNLILLAVIPLIADIACMRLFMFTQADNISGKIVVWQETQFKRVWLPVFVRDMQKNLICHGVSNVRRIKVFLFSLSVLALVAALAMFGVRLPSFWIGFMEETGARSTASFIATAYPIGMSLLNKISVFLFPFAEKAQLVRKVVLASKELPDTATFLQTGINTVIVDYRGNTIDCNEFIKYHRQLSEGCGCKITVKPLEFGKVLLTFGSKERVDLGEWSSNNGNALTRGEKQRYVYALLTGQEIKNERILKMGVCTDPDSTLTTYGRGIIGPRYFFVLQEGNGLNEATMAEHFKKFHVKLPNRKGEFYRECDGWYEAADLFLQRWQNNLTGELRRYLSSEIEGRELV